MEKKLKSITINNRGVKMRSKSSKSKKIIISLILIIIILLSLILLMFLGVIGKKESCSSDEVIAQKSSVDNQQIIQYYKSMIGDFEEARHEYSVVDINNDNIPELLIYTHGIIGNSIIANTNIYTYDENLGNDDNNYIVFVGTINGRFDNDTILYKMNDGTLLSVSGNMGYEIVSSYSLENDWIIRKSYSTKEVEEYMTGDKEITFKPCTDMSLLDEYK